MFLYTDVVVSNPKLDPRERFRTVEFSFFGGEHAEGPARQERLEDIDWKAPRKVRSVNVDYCNQKLTITGLLLPTMPSLCSPSTCPPNLQMAPFHVTHQLQIHKAWCCLCASKSHADLGLGNDVGKAVGAH